jgi:hypothetical protein
VSRYVRRPVASSARTSPSSSSCCNAIIDHGEIVVLDTPEQLKASVGKDRMQIVLLGAAIVQFRRTD